MANEQESATLEQTKKAIAKILGDNYGIDENELNDDSNLEELGLDSLDFVEVTMDCEREFNIDISDESIEDCKSFIDFCNVVDNLKA